MIGFGEFGQSVLRFIPWAIAPWPYAMRNCRQGHNAHIPDEARQSACHAPPCSCAAGIEYRHNGSQLHLGSCRLFRVDRPTRFTTLCISAGNTGLPRANRSTHAAVLGPTSRGWRSAPESLIIIHAAKRAEADMAMVGLGLASTSTMRAALISATPDSDDIGNLRRRRSRHILP